MTDFYSLFISHQILGRPKSLVGKAVAGKSPSRRKSLSVKGSRDQAMIHLFSLLPTMRCRCHFKKWWNRKSGTTRIGSFFPIFSMLLCNTTCENYNVSIYEMKGYPLTKINWIFLEKYFTAFYLLSCPIRISYPLIFRTESYVCLSLHSHSLSFTIACHPQNSMYFIISHG